MSFLEKGVDSGAQQHCVCWRITFTEKEKRRRNVGVSGQGLPDFEESITVALVSVYVKER